MDQTRNDKDFFGIHGGAQKMGHARVQGRPYRFRVAAVDAIDRLRITVAGVLWLMLALALSPSHAIAQERETQSRELVVGTKEAPPFAMKDEHGNWKGISIDLWRHVAGNMGLQYRFAEGESVNALLDGLQAGNFDVAVAAITVTPAREQQVDFSTPYFHTGTGVAVQADRISNWLPVIRSIASYSFLQAALALLGLTFLAGLLIWFFERRSNDAFAGGVAQGLSSGVWWSTNAMTQRALEGGLAPMTLPGRVVAVIWMVVSVIAIALFTAGITSALTTKRLHGAVNNLADLSSVRVATVQGTETEDALSRMRIDYRTVPSPLDGFDELKKGTIDALAYDRPILAWLIRQRRFSAELADVTFEPQQYAIALRNDSALRKQINVALLEAEETDWWKDILFRYLGQR
jgi:polar amino acid transport system substrate-binding protein